MNSTVNLFLTGNLLPGFSAETAVPLLAKMMRVSDEQALKCLSGRRTLVKRGLPTADSAKYLQALSRMGVEAVIEEVPQEVPVSVIVPVVKEDSHGFPAITSHFSENLPSEKEAVGGLVVMPAIKSVGAEPQEPGLPVIPELALSPTPAERKPLTMADLVPVEGAIIDTPAIETPLIEEITCPVCQMVQPKRTLCRQCGTDMPRALLAKQQPREPDHGTKIQAIPGLRQFEKVEEFTPSPFGFWPTGRIGRLRYLAFQIFAYLPIIVGVFIGGLLGVFTGKPTISVLAVIGVCSWIGVHLMMRATALRLHDFGLSGKWILTPFIAVLMVITGSPVAAVVTLMGFWVLSILICFWPGAMEDNKYGSPAGENTIWVYLGCILCVVLIAYSVISSATQAKAAYHDFQQMAYQKEHPEEGEYTTDNEATDSESTSQRDR